MSAAVGTASASEVQERTITVWQDRVRIRVLSKGRGPSLVFFHGPWGLTWDPFLDELAQHFTVHAPEHPGTTPDAHDDVYHLDGLWDLVLCYDELMTALGIKSAVMVGHSFGGMVACELAATYPDRTRRQALIAPLGFWRDPECDAAHQMFPRSDGHEAGAAAARVRMVWAMGTTGKFIWPIPDKGLKKRIHRVASPTLLVWGGEDRLIPPVYAEEFAGRLRDARVQIVGDAGHAPHLEQPTTVARVVREFLSQ